MAGGCGVRRTVLDARESEGWEMGAGSGEAGEMSGGYNFG